MGDKFDWQAMWVKILSSVISLTGLVELSMLTVLTHRIVISVFPILHLPSLLLLYYFILESIYDPLAVPYVGIKTDFLSFKRHGDLCFWKFKKPLTRQPDYGLG